MYCKNCGGKLPDDAKICNFCGTPVIQVKVNGKPAPKQEPAKPPVTQEKPPVVNVTPEKSPVIPVTPEQPPVTPVKPVQPPVIKEIPQEPVQEIKTEPWKPEWQEGKLPEPPVMEVKSPKSPVMEEKPVFHEPKSYDNIPAEVTPPQQPKKRIRKLPILLGILALIGILLLVNGGKKETPEKPKNNKPITITEKKQEEKEEPRYDAVSFLFTHEEFEDQYTELLKEMGSPLKLKGEREKWDNFQRTYLYQGNQQVGYITSQTDPDTGKIVLVNAGTIYEKGVSEPSQEQMDAIGLLVKAACGSKAAEMPQLELLAEDSTGTVYASSNDIIHVYAIISDSDYGVLATVNNLDDLMTAAAAEEETEPETKPEVKRNFLFDGEGILLTKEDYLKLYQAMLAELEIDVEFGEARETGTNEYLYWIQRGSEKVGYLNTEALPSGKLTSVSVTFYMDENNTWNQEHMMAGIMAYAAAHGSMTGDQLEQILNQEPNTDKEDYTTYNYDVDGLICAVILSTTSQFYWIHV